MGAMLKCSFGMAPSTLSVIIPLRPKAQNMLMATITDVVPMANIMSFSMCQSLGNPTVASATSAAMGVLTPMPCIPVIAGTWTPSSKVKIMGTPALLDNAKCSCAYGGQISIISPGNMMAEGK
jgi:hypothetical protein